MKLLCWNIRRLGNLRAVRRVRHLIKLKNHQVVFLMETKIHEKSMVNLRTKFGFTNGFDISMKGSKGGLSLAWKGNYLISLMNYSINHINVNIVDEENNLH